MDEKIRAKGLKKSKGGDGDEDAAEERWQTAEDVTGKMISTVTWGEMKAEMASCLVLSN